MNKQDNIKIVNRDVLDLPTTTKELISKNVPTNIKTISKEMSEASGTDEKTFYNNLKTNANSKNAIVKEKAERTINQFIDGLTALTLKQILLDNFGTDYIQTFNNMFAREMLDMGNTIEYIKTIQTGHGNFESEKYNPDAPTDARQENESFNMYKPNEVTQILEDYAFRYKKNFSDRQAVFIPYFLTDKLLELIAMVIASMWKTFDLRLYDINMKIINTKANYIKQVTGTATNMFLSFVDEIFPLIESMKYLSSDFNLKGGSLALNSANKEDLIMILPIAIKSAFESGVRSQLFNANLTNITDHVSAVFATGNTLTIGDGNTPITVSSTEYITANTCIVLNKAAILNHFQLRKNSLQEYANNLITEHIIHFWGLANISKFGMGFWYENANFGVQPN